MKTEFAIRMGKLRQEKGLSQRQAAMQLGISQALLSHYETGAREPKFEFVLDVCAFYEVSSDYLLGLTDSRTSKSKKLSREVYEIVTSLEVLKKEEAELLDKLLRLVESNE